MRRILEKYKAGVFFQPEDSDSFQAAVDFFYKNRSQVNNAYSQGLNKMKKDSRLSQSKFISSRAEEPASSVEVGELRVARLVPPPPILIDKPAFPKPTRDGRLGGVFDEGFVFENCSGLNFLRI